MKKSTLYFILFFLFTTGGIMKSFAEKQVIRYSGTTPTAWADTLNSYTGSTADSLYFEFTNGAYLSAIAETQGIFSAFPNAKYLDMSGAAFLENKFPDYAFMNFSNPMERITLPPSVVEIGLNAFDGCINLVSAKATGVKTIRTRAFLDSGLRIIDATDFPAAETIEEGSFSGCNNLVEIRFDKVTSLGGTSHHSLLFPANLKFLTLGSIPTIPNNYFNAHPGLVRVVLDKATSIGAQSFYNLPNLSEINMSSLQVIGTEAFANCPKLVKIYLPKVITVEERAFIGPNSELENISLPEAITIGDYAFNACDALENISFPKLTSIAPNMLPAMPDSILTINMNSVTTIDANRFKDFVKLESIELDAAITIGDSAFKNTVLTSLDLPAATSLGAFAAITTNGSITSVSMPELESIGDSALIGNNEVKSLTLDKLTYMGINPFPTELEYLSLASMTAIPDFSFNDYQFLAEVNMPEVTAVGDSAFCNTILTSINMPELITMDRFAFFGVSTLNNISFPELVTIGDSALWGTSLTDVRLESLTGMGVQSFPVSLETIQLDAMVTIPEKAFVANTALESAILPEVISVSDSAFVDLVSLTDISLPKVDILGNYSFKGCNLQSITPPTFDVLKVLGDSALMGNSALTQITLPLANQIGTNSFPVELQEISLPAIDSIPAGAFQIYTTLNSVDMEKVTDIAAHAFDGCAALQTINFPELISLGDSALLGTQVYEISFEKLEKLGMQAFATGLTSLELPSIQILKDSVLAGYTALADLSLVKIDSIGKSTLAGCTALTEINFPELSTLEDSAFAGCSALETIVLPQLPAVGQSAFINCAIESIDMPVVGEIKKQAFAGNTTLTAIDFPTVTALGDSAFAGCSALANIAFTNAGMTTIPASAFSGTTSLDSIRATDLPNVTAIGDSAFLNSGLKYISVPNGGTIGKYAFANNPLLGLMDIMKATNIGDYAFDGCLGLAIIRTGSNGPVTVGTGAFPSASFGYPVLVFVDAADEASWGNGSNPFVLTPSYYIYNNEGGSFPADTTIYVGENVTFAYNLQGAAVTDVSWETPNGTISTGGNPAITINDAEFTDGGTYLMKFSYNGATVTLEDVVRLNVICKNTTISTEPVANNQVLCSGDAQVLSVVADGSKLTYQWYKDNVALAGAENSIYSATETGAYKVDVINNCGASLMSGEVDVTVNPYTAITRDLEDASICVNSDYTLSVETAGAGLTYQWYRENQPIEGATAFEYTIQSASVIDYDNYTVQVSGICGETVTSNIARIWVADSLTNINLEVPEIVRVGQTYRLHVGNDFGYSDVTEYIWEFDNDQINFSESAGANLHTTFAVFGPEVQSGTITVRMKHGCAPEGYYSASQYVNVNPAGINDIESNTVTVYPNPVVDQLTIKGTVAGQTIRLYNTQGSQIGVYNTQEGITTLDFSSFGTGNYILNVGDKNIKVVK